MATDTARAAYTDLVHACNDVGFWTHYRSQYEHSPQMMSEFPEMVEEIDLELAHARKRTSAAFRRAKELGLDPLDLRDRYAQSVIPAPPTLESVALYPKGDSVSA